MKIRNVMDNDKLFIYNHVKEVPETAKKEIKAGRIKGFTDINPMWRIKKLTEMFGACGIGWKYEIKSKSLEKGACDTVAAFIEIDLYYKYNGEWSEPIPGIGGSSFVSNEKGGLYTSDECYKMALTDAISVACKAIGVGADVYYEKDSTKYNNLNIPLTPEQQIEKMKQDVFTYMDSNNEYRCEIFRHFSVNSYEELEKENIASIYKNLHKKGVLR